MDFSPADQYPFAALFVSKEAGPLCTGALVSSRAVLTAASCASPGRGKPAPDLVYVGMSNMYLDAFRWAADQGVAGLHVNAAVAQAT